MASTIRIKRRETGAAGAPGSLLSGELAYNQVDSKLYIGTSTGIAAIAGSGAVVDLSSAQTVGGDKTFSGAVDVASLKLAGSAITADAAEINVLDGAIAGSAVGGKALVVDSNKDLNLGTGDLTVTDLVVSGSLTVNGSSTIINSTVVSVDDINLELGATASPTDVTANGGGIILKGTSDKSLVWLDATDAWTSSEHVDLAAGKSFKIAGSNVLSATALGSGVVSSSLTSVGTISSGVWQGSAVGIAYGGTGASTAQGAINALTDVASATNGYVLTKDASTGNAVFKAAPAGAFDSDPEIQALAGLTSAADALPYFTGSGTASTTTLSSFGRSLIDDADASAARSTLGLAIGTNVQAFDAELSAIAGLTSAADKGIMFSGAGTAATFDLSSFGRSLVDDADASAARTTLGLGSIATQAASNVAITGGSIDGVTLDGGSF